MKVGVIGHLGGPEIFSDGQTVKTKNLVMLLENAGFEVIKADTYFNKVNKARLLADTMVCLLRCRHIFLLVSEGGMRFYLPFLYYINKLTRRRIYHYVIGSELLQMVASDAKMVRYLNALDVNWFEYDSGTAFLRENGVRNAWTLPNFKFLKTEDHICEYDGADNLFRFCTFSRVMEEKGISDAIEAVAGINAEQGKVIARLDIYGPVEADYRLKFEQLLRAHGDCVSYRGIADSEGSVEILKRYYALLFPTRWAGEGVPGTLIDAFAAGVPVIATDWNANREIITHNKQGVIYPNDSMPDLDAAVSWAIAHPEKMADMRRESKQEFTRYLPETILETILRQMKGPVRE